MKGCSTNVALGALATFAAAFAAGAIAIFGAAFVAGMAVHVDQLSLSWRLEIVAAALAVLAFADLAAIRKRTYCPLSWRRQALRSLRFRYGIIRTVAVWGFDTGLAVTTFRVTALTWAALLLTFLELGSWQIGFAYALAFVVPLITILKGQPTTNRSSRSLEALLRQRAVLQYISITVLFATGLLLLAQVAQ